MAYINNLLVGLKPSIAISDLARGIKLVLQILSMTMIGDTSNRQIQLAVRVWAFSYSRSLSKEVFLPPLSSLIPKVGEEGVVCLDATVLYEL